LILDNQYNFDIYKNYIVGSQTACKKSKKAVRWTIIVYHIWEWYCGW